MPQDITRIIDPNPSPVEDRLRDGDEAAATIRPKLLADFVGQEQLKKNLSMAIQSAKQRGAAMDHLLFFGPPGLGKTTLAQIVANELGVNFRATAGPVLTRAGDIAAILTALQENDVLFIDEIHRLHPSVEEILYSAMEDFQIDILIGEGPSAKSVRINLKPFTLIAATTRAGLIAKPLRDRFGLSLHLDFYNEGDLAKIITRQASIFNITLGANGAAEIAKRSRGTPRVAGRLTRRVRDHGVINKLSVIDQTMVVAAMSNLAIDSLGLDDLDRKYLTCLAEFYSGGPTGIDNLCAALGNERDILEEVVEPFLIQKGFIMRTSRGRVLGKEGYSYLGLKPKNPIVADAQFI
ncbi:MAG: Holliday junction branch migration DNA helicase RuvB [Hydrotalea sp.]|nr:Holliday junction branch migration DNA helicase RuvB [Hydrotalea sp.]